MTNSSTRDALSAYTKTDVETSLEGASPHELILMLFDAAIKAVVKARLALQRHEVATKCAAISRAMAIIQDGLQLSLDVKAGGELATNLNDLYEFMCQQLLIANAHNQTEPLDVVGRLLLELKGGWSAIGHATVRPNLIETVPPQRTTALSYGKA